MAILATGRICIKKTGKNAGQKVVVLKLEGNKALIDGPKLKRKKVNIRHLFPLDETINILDSSSHEEIKEIMEK